MRVPNPWINQIRTKIESLRQSLNDIEFRVQSGHLGQNESNFIFKLKAGKSEDVNNMTGKFMAEVNKELDKKMRQRDEAQEMRTIQEKGQKRLEAMILETGAIL